jgi:lipid-binding SYLF domain-containing protein
VLRITALHAGGTALLKLAPVHVHVKARLKVWWDTTSGVLRAAFVARPHIDYAAQMDLLARCGLPRGCTDRLVSSIVPLILERIDEKRPLTLPLEAPVAFKISEVAADEEDSLAALPGLVREASRVLRGLTNPLVVDSIVPRAAFQMAKGIVVMTHVRGGAMMWGAGMGSGILLRKMPTGVWSGPASIGTVAANIGIQFGFRKTDTLLILPSDYHIDTFIQALDGAAQVKLGANVGVAAGPLGRDASVDARVGEGGATVCLSYSHSQGLYAGWNVEGEVLVGRKSDNEECSSRDDRTWNGGGEGLSSEWPVPCKPTDVRVLRARAGTTTPKT